MPYKTCRRHDISTCGLVVMLHALRTILRTKYVYNMHLYVVPQCLSRPLVGIGTAHSLSLKRVCPPGAKWGGGEHTRLGERGWGVPIRTTGEKA